jgi:V8-like Glu-specific endopeptidase
MQLKGMRRFLWQVLLLALLDMSKAFAAADLDLQPLAKDSPLLGRLGAIGMVIVGEPDHIRAMGSGFLVTPCHVLTAGHVVTHGTDPIKLGLEVRFVPSSGERAFVYRQNEIYGKVIAASEHFVAHQYTETFDVDNIAQDWALIELEQTLPEIQPLKLLYAGTLLPAETSMFSLGYAASRGMTYLYAHEHCPLRPGHHGAGMFGQLLLADCAVRPGMSGGPLLFEGQDRQLVAAGIVVERFQSGERVLTVAVPTRSFADQITPLLRASRVCAAGQPFALPARQDAPVH